MQQNTRICPCGSYEIWNIHEIIVRFKQYHTAIINARKTFNENLIAFHFDKITLDKKEDSFDDIYEFDDFDIPNYDLADDHNDSDINNYDDYDDEYDDYYWDADDSIYYKRKLLRFAYKSIFTNNQDVSIINRNVVFYQNKHNNRQNENKMIRNLFKIGSLGHLVNSDNQTFLDLAIINRDIDMVNFFLLDNSFLLNNTLPLAALYGYEDIVLLLLGANVPVNSKRIQDGRTALHLSRNIIVTKYLLVSEDININALDNSGQTPLHVAVLNGDTDIVSLLLKVGVKYNIYDDFGWSPLHIAKQLEYTAISNLLNIQQ